MNVFDQIHEEIAVRRAEHERLYNHVKKTRMEELLSAAAIADLMMSKKGRKCKDEKN